jgi:protein-disulfide isomerase
MTKLKLEFQYFEGCPNHIKMQNNISEAIKGLEDKIALKKVLVEDEATAKQVGFRGSPTLLINDEDIEGIPAPQEPALACRFYANGIPDADKIRQIIIQKINME